MDKADSINFDFTPTNYLIADFRLTPTGSNIYDRFEKGKAGIAN
jgi:hypothetical protein